MREEAAESDRIRILVVDDEDVVRMTIAQILTRAGYQVAMASNGKEGLAMLAKTSFDLVVTDVIMPEKDGVETTIEVRHRFPKTRILVISGGGRIHNLDFLEHAARVGADAILRKPFSRTELLDAVTEALGKG